MELEKSMDSSLEQECFQSSPQENNSDWWSSKERELPRHSKKELASQG